MNQKCNITKLLNLSDWRIYQVLIYFSNLLKFATMIGTGKVMHKTPQTEHKEATSFPPAVFGQMSP